MNYEEVLKIKEECYRVIREQLGDEYLKVFKYYKGDLLPIINTKVRKNMTCGDIDCFQWDFSKNVLRIIESKRTNEKNKVSQDRFLYFLSQLNIPEYKFAVYKIIADPPFEKVKIIHINSGLEKEYNSNEFIDFLNME